MPEGRSEMPAPKPNHSPIKVLRTGRMRAELQNVKKEARQSKFDSLIDPLTGLHNRRWLFGDEQAKDRKGQYYRLFEEAKKSGNGLAVMMFDLDDFGKINKKYNWDVGDQVIKGYADACRQVMRKSDTLARYETEYSESIARYGGDEFVGMLSDISNINPTLVNKILGRLTHRLLEEFRGVEVDYVEDGVSERRFIDVSSSIGVAIFDPKKDGDIDPDEFLSRAQAAAKLSKLMSKKKHMVWDEQTQEKIKKIESQSSRVEVSPKG